MIEYMDPGFQMPPPIPAHPFINLDKTCLKLDDLMGTLADQFSLPKGGSENYGLMYEKFGKINVQNSDKSVIFLTEESLQNLKDGFVLIVTASPVNLIYF